MMAYCGLTCDSCPIYLATLEQDKSHQQEMRISIARLCSEQYGMNLKPEDITDCDGCRIESGRLFSGCEKCKIRKCARQKGLENCAHCSEYACEKLREFFVTDQGAKTRLDMINSTI